MAIDIEVFSSEFGTEIQPTALRFFQRGGTHRLRTAAVAAESRRAVVIQERRRAEPGGLN